jgi:hypothetical protein
MIEEWRLEITGGPADAEAIFNVKSTIFNLQ